MLERVVRFCSLWAAHCLCFARGLLDIPGFRLYFLRPRLVRCCRCVFAWLSFALDLLQHAFQHRRDAFVRVAVRCPWYARNTAGRAAPLRPTFLDTFRCAGIARTLHAPNHYAIPVV